MPRTVKQVHDMEIDEISLVDRPANQHARLAIAKRHSPAEDQMSKFFDAQGDEVTEADLQPGDLVQDESGATFLYDPNDEFEVDGSAEDDGVQATTDDLVGAGVSKAFESHVAQGPGLVEAVSKALEGVTTSTQREEVYKSALAAAEQRSTRAEQIAKSEREVRLSREYIAKAAEYNVPVRAEELGPVLMRLAVDPASGEAWAPGTQQYADCAVIHKSLETAGALLTTELGYAGFADNDDPFTKVEAVLDQTVSKSGGAVSKAQAVEAYFDADPGEYDAYRALQGQR